MTVALMMEWQPEYTRRVVVGIYPDTLRLKANDNKPKDNIMTSIRSDADYEQMSEFHTFIPEHMREGFKRYIEQGIPLGSYGKAVITNNLREAAGRADPENAKHIVSTVAWMHNFAPCDCWGSAEAMERWIKMHEKERKNV